MLREIVEYLYSFNDTNWHELNRFLKVTCGGDLESVRAALVSLEQNKRIHVKDQRHTKLGTYQRLQAADSTNTPTNLDNWPIEAKLTLEEKEKMYREKDAKTLSNLHIQQIGINYGTANQDTEIHRTDFTPSEPSNNAFINRVWRFISGNALIAGILATVIGSIIFYFIFQKK